jgi:hypothetical protein
MFTSWHPIDAVPPTPLHNPEISGTERVPGLLLETEWIYQLRSYCTFGEQTAINITHWRVPLIGAPLIDTANIALIADGLLAPHYKGLLAKEASYHGADCATIWPAATQPLTSVTGLGIGTAIGGILPGQTSGLIRFRGLRAGRHGRGRMYVPFPAVGDCGLTGAPMARYMTALNSMAIVLLDGIQSTSSPGAAGHLKLGLWDKTGKVFDQVWQVAAPAAFATQRRRGHFGRLNPPPF